MDWSSRESCRLDLEGLYSRGDEDWIHQEEIDELMVEALRWSDLPSTESSRLYYGCYRFRKPLD
jgi:hypothetical protein